MNDRSMLDALVAADRAAPGPEADAAERAWPGVHERTTAGEVPAVSDAAPALGGSAAAVPTVIATVVVGAIAVGAVLWLTGQGPEEPAERPPSSAPAVAVTETEGTPPAPVEPASEEPPVLPAPVVVPPKPEEAPATAPDEGSTEGSAAKPKPRKPPAPEASEPAPSELSLIRTIQTALKSGDAKGALRAIADHERHYPKGALVQEREAGRVRALCAKGSKVKAQRAAERFEKRWPTSSHLERVRSACW